MSNSNATDLATLQRDVDNIYDSINIFINRTISQGLTMTGTRGGVSFRWSARVNIDDRRPEINLDIKLPQGHIYKPRAFVGLLRADRERKEEEEEEEGEVPPEEITVVPPKDEFVKIPAIPPELIIPENRQFLENLLSMVSDEILLLEKTNELLQAQINVLESLRTSGIGQVSNIEFPGFINTGDYKTTSFAERVPGTTTTQHASKKFSEIFVIKQIIFASASSGGVDIRYDIGIFTTDDETIDFDANVKRIWDVQGPSAPVLMLSQSPIILFPNYIVKEVNRYIQVSFINNNAGINAMQCYVTTERLEPAIFIT